MWGLYGSDLSPSFDRGDISEVVRRLSALKKAMILVGSEVEYRIVGESSQLRGLAMFAVRTGNKSSGSLGCLGERRWVPVARALGVEYSRAEQPTGRLFQSCSSEYIMFT